MSEEGKVPQAPDTSRLREVARQTAANSAPRRLAVATCPSSEHATPRASSSTFLVRSETREVERFKMISHASVSTSLIIFNSLSVLPRLNPAPSSPSRLPPFDARATQPRSHKPQSNSDPRP